MRKIITIFILLSIMIFGENKTKTVEVVYSDFETMHLNTPIDVTFRIFQEGYIRIHETQTKYKNTFSVVFLIPQRSVYDYRHLVITGFMSISWTQFFSFFTNIFSQIL